MSEEIEPPSDGADVGDAEQRADRWDAEVDAIRDELGGLVGELDRRRHRASKPLAVGAIIVAIALGGLLLWWLVRPRDAAA